MFNNTSVADLSELRYFTGLRSLPNNQFAYVSANTIILPEGLLTLGQSVFGGNQPARTLIDLPSTLTSVNYFGYYAPVTLICRAVIPPAITYNYSWASGKDNTAIYVPDGSVDAYKAHAKWSKMGASGTSVAEHIKPLSEYQP